MGGVEIISQACASKTFTCQTQRTVEFEEDLRPALVIVPNQQDSQQLHVLEVEDLSKCFPPRHFDLVHMRNSLDHAIDPIYGMLQLLHVRIRSSLHCWQRQT